MSDYTLVSFVPHNPAEQALLASQELTEIYLRQLEEDFNKALGEVRGLIVREGGTRGVLTALGTWIRFSVSHVSLQAAALTRNIELFSLPAKSLIEAAILRPTTAFAGTGSYTLSIGLSGDLGRYLPAFDVAQTPGNTVFAANSVLDLLDFGAATSIRIAAVSDSANLDQSTAGAADIWLKLARLP